LSSATAPGEIHPPPAWRAAPAVFSASSTRRSVCQCSGSLARASAGRGRPARGAFFPNLPWKRCQFHLQQNAQAYVPNVALRPQVGRDLRSVLNTSERGEANERLAKLVEKYRRPAPKLAEWMEANVPEGLTLFALPEPHRRRLRTTNALERLNRELHRRTRVATLFPNQASLLRLVSAMAGEIRRSGKPGEST
jgi:transposase-like protein